MCAPVSKQEAEAVLLGPVEGQNLQYDMGVLGNTWRELRPLTLQGERYCTRIAARLGDIQAGYAPFKPRYSLAALVERYFREDISEQKGDRNSWRMRFSELDGKPLHEWPPGAREYALQDVVLEDRCVQHQARELGEAERAHAKRLTLASIALQHCTIDGIRLDLALLHRIHDNAMQELDEANRVMCLTGWAQPNKKGGISIQRKKIQEQIRACFEARGEPTPYSAPSKTFPFGQVKYDEDTLLLSDHPVLARWASASAARKVVSGYTQPWIDARLERIHPEYDLPKETGRTSCRKPNIQQLPRPTKANAEHGGMLRKVLVPDEGMVFVWADYDQIELCAIAQLCLWQGFGNTLANDINDGVDVHCRVGAMLLDIGLERFDRENPEHAIARQDAKAVNYGRPGGLGAKGLQKAAAGQGRILSLDRCHQLIDAHARAYPDVDQYVRESIRRWKYITKSVFVPHPDLPPFERLCLKPTQACNTRFQGLIAMGALEAFVEVARQAYSDGDWWPSLFVHDEIVVQAPVQKAEKIQRQLESIMIRCMQRHLPDVRVGAQGKRGERWTKG